MRLSLLLLVLTLLLVVGLEKMTEQERITGTWPPEPEYKVVVTNNGPFFYVE
ncbi:MAG: hypothetical protein AB7E32_05435 [Desulfovibrio sp.]